MTAKKIKEDTVQESVGEQLESTLAIHLLRLARMTRDSPAVFTEWATVFLYYMPYVERLILDSDRLLARRGGVKDDRLREPIALVFLARRRLEEIRFLAISEGLFAGENLMDNEKLMKRYYDAIGSPTVLEKAPKFEHTIDSISRFNSMYERELELAAARLAVRLSDIPSLLREGPMGPQGERLRETEVLENLEGLYVGLHSSLNLQDDPPSRATLRMRLKTAAKRGKITRFGGPPVEYLKDDFGLA